MDAAGEDPLTVMGESARGDSDRGSVWSTSDPTELAPGNESSDGVGEAIFNQTSSLSFVSTASSSERSAEPSLKTPSESK